MNKLFKPFFGILFILALGLNCFGQQYYPNQPARRVAPQRYPAQPQRYQQQYPQRYPQQHLNPGYVRPVYPGTAVNRFPNAGRKVEAVKEAFIGRQLNLTSRQSRDFWPLYRQYVQDQTAIRILRRQNLMNSPNGTIKLEKDLAYETELVNIRKHYMDEFLKIIPPEKISELYKSEREFNDEMLKQLSERSIRAGN